MSFAVCVRASDSVLHRTWRTHSTQGGLHFHIHIDSQSTSLLKMHMLSSLKLLWSVGLHDRTINKDM